MIEQILPATVACAEAFTDPPSGAFFPQEAAIVARAVEKRRREFTTGRHCARIALGKLGVTSGPILVGERGAPRWPPGIVGSITHCDGYRAAAVARVGDMAAIGLDAEPNDPLPRGVLDVVSHAAERARLAVLAAAGPTPRLVAWDRLLFSAKESVYKAWFPLTGRWLGFKEADVTIEPDGTFTVRLLPTAPSASPSPSPPTSFAGRWLVGGGLVLTAIAVAAATGPGALAGAAGAPGADAGGGFARGDVQVRDRHGHAERPRARCGRPRTGQ